MPRNPFLGAVFIGGPDQSPSIRLERMLEVVIIGLCTSSIIWLWLELGRVVWRPSRQRSKALSFHHPAALGSLFVIAAIALRHLTATIIDFQISKPAGLEWLSIAAVVALLVACIWDKDAKHAVASLYFTPADHQHDFESAHVPHHTWHGLE